MKIIQENEYLDAVKNEVEPYLKAHCGMVHSGSRRHLP